MITCDILKKLDKKTTHRALFLTVFLVVLCAASIFYIFIQKKRPENAFTACIYQNGALVKTIDLSTVTEPYTLTFEAAGGGFNVIEVRPGAIGILDADCPDRLCVSMGFADSSLLPIICLPHSLVIELHPADTKVSDAIAY